MDEAEFQRLLAAFPIVRRRNYCRVQWKNTKPQSVTSEDATAITALPVLSEYSTFEKALEGYFKTYFRAQEAKEAYRCTKQAIDDFVSSLNIEDINHMCDQLIRDT
uniref:Uncharacterized protein AlNc14C141G7245 n=1 Tax=Albugo laibachii Nc14 TaxID=890382 RepID=F0WL57_9STRA|nr:conserved hypothetical protein [Albugo laibachii Nc14]|eukprot:CCA22018.1 conserved hypothetical protein [Albugo laibachii Nc14]